MVKPIQKMCDELLKHCQITDGTIQHREMTRAFFSGAFALLHLTKSVCERNNELAAAHKLNELELELEKKLQWFVETDRETKAAK